jgi:copper chaperone CopZ
MKYFIPAFALLFATPTLAHANTVVAHVDGMVCAFCAKGIEDKLKEHASVGDVVISLDDTSVTVKSKPGQTIDEAVVRKAVDYMGYTVRDIKTEQ